MTHEKDLVFEVHVIERGETNYKLAEGGELRLALPEIFQWCVDKLKAYRADKPPHEYKAVKIVIRRSQDTGGHLFSLTSDNV